IMAVVSWTKLWPVGITSMCFFFSSRRRHTRSKRDWSSDVCSSDLVDDALLQNYPRVTIIHGKGTGALRKGVEQFIKAHHQIKSSRIGGASEGGSGVTILELE